MHLLLFWNEVRGENQGHVAITEQMLEGETKEDDRIKLMTVSFDTFEHL